MARLDRHMQRLESLRRRLGFIIDALCIRQIASCVLSIIPVRRTADGASVRIRCWSDILAYEEIFTGGIYDSVFDAAPVATYCDLGCQSGMAILRLVNRSGPPACSLLIDGNPRAVARCRENVREAGIRHAVVVHGAVGCGAGDAHDGTVHFKIVPNELECCVAEIGATPMVALTLPVPAIDLEAAWREHCGDVSCELLKMDIEGAELNVLRTESRLLKRVQRCVLEWHDPPASLAEITNMLRTHGFVDIESIWQRDSTGVLTCRRSRCDDETRSGADACGQ